MAGNVGLIHLGTWSLENCVPNKKILAKVLVFMGGFGVWAQVWSKGSCVGKVEITSPIPVNSSSYYSH